MRLKIERSGNYLISLFLTDSLFLDWYEEFWIITLIILLIVYILGTSKHLIKGTPQYCSAMIVRGVSAGASIEPPWCREMPVSRAAVRLIAVVFPVCPIYYLWPNLNFLHSAFTENVILTKFLFFGYLNQT